MWMLHILLYTKVFEIMIKNNDLLLLSPSLVFHEDIYLIDSRGNIIFKREAQSRSINNIFALLPEEEREFIAQNKSFLDMQSLLLVDSAAGPIFIDVLLYCRFGVFTAIIPHFAPEEIYAVFKERLQYCVGASDRILNHMNEASACLNGEHYSFAQRLLYVHRGAFYYRVRYKTNAELAMLMSETACAYGKLYGCAVDLSINGLSEFDLKNTLCIASYQFTLASICLLARAYAKERVAQIYVYFDENGIYLECGFKLADGRDKNFMQNGNSELSALFRVADMNFYACNYYKSSSAFAIRTMPWYKCPSSMELKQKKPKLIYD